MRYIYHSSFVSNVCEVGYRIEAFTWISNEYDWDHNITLSYMHAVTNKPQRTHSEAPRSEQSSANMQ